MKNISVNEIDGEMLVRVLDYQIDLDWLIEQDSFPGWDSYTGRFMVQDIDGNIIYETAMKDGVNSDATTNGRGCTTTLQEVGEICVDPAGEAYCAPVVDWITDCEWRWVGGSTGSGSGGSSGTGNASNNGGGVGVGVNGGPDYADEDISDLLAELEKARIEEQIRQMQENMDCAKMANLHGQERKNQWDFYNKYKNWFRDDIIGERGDFSISGIGSQPGGPSLEYRYIEDPLNGNLVIDMRHLLIIGKYGRVVGESVEFIQWLGNNESAFDDQDYYSNELGYLFYEHFGAAIESNPNGITDYFITFINDFSLRNSVSDPERCK